MLRHPIEDFILTHLSQHPADITRYASEHFKVSTQAIHKHLKSLLFDGKIQRQGKTRDARYLLTVPSDQAHAAMGFGRKMRVSISSSLDPDSLWRDTFAQKIDRVSKNVEDIAKYSFIELLKNVKAHAEANYARVSIERYEHKIELSIFDDGIGVFENIRAKSGLSTLREAVLEFAKGQKFGEGVFYASRACDRFTVKANGLTYIRLGEEDWFLGSDSTVRRGTLVSIETNLNSKKDLSSLQRKYPSSKTEVAVELSRFEGEPYLSRAQARRVLSGLERFKTIILDFRRVEMIGESFADEVFRVYKAQHPGTEFKCINANPDVEFMISNAPASPECL